MNETATTDSRFPLPLRMVPLFALVCVTLSYFAFSQVLGTFFLSDDFGLIGRVASGSFFATWGETHGGFLRPLTVATFWLDYAVWGLNPDGFHLTNLTLHGLNAFLVGVLAWGLFERFVPNPTKRWLMSYAAAILFLVLPCHSEPVAWISGRTDLIATFFGLISILAFLWFLKRETFRYLIVSCLSFGLALLAKESVLSLPAILILVAIVQRPGEWRTRSLAGSIGLYALVLAGYLLARYITLGTPLGGYGAHGHLAIDFPGIADRLTRHVLRVAAPPLGIDLGPALQTHWRTVLFGYTVLGGVLVAAAFSRWRLRSLARAMLFFAACFLVALIPVFTLTVSTVNTQGDRFLYFPSVFAAIGVTLFLVQVFKRRYVGVAAIVTYTIVCFGFLSSNIYDVWRQAGLLSEEIAREVTATAETAHAPVIVVNVPADLRGAYVFQNGLPEAVGLLSNTDTASRVHALSAHSIQSIGEAVDVQWSQSERTFEVRFTNPRSRFIRVLDTEMVVDTTTHSTGYVIAYKGIESGSIVLGYGKDALTRLRGEGSISRE